MSVGAVNKNTGDRIPTAGMPAIDSVLSGTSTNPVQNAIITAALADKQNKTDNNLQTTDKTVVGAINEHEGDIDSLKSGLIDVNSSINSLNVVTTVSASYTNANIDSGSDIEAYTLGKLIFVSGYFKATANIAKSDEIATIGVTPMNAVWVTTNNCTIKFSNTNGKILADTALASTDWQTFTIIGVTN